jgi:membrane dipeptidase
MPLSLRWFLPCLAAAVLAAAALVAQTPRKVSDSEVASVQRSAILIDTHNDVTSDTVDGLEFGKRRATGHTDLERLLEGGVGATFFAAFVDGHYVKTNQSAHRTLEMIDTVRHDIVDRYPDRVRLALTASDIEAAHRDGKFAALIGIEGGHAIEDSLRLLRDYYALGVRYMTLTHVNTNNWADSSGDIDDASVVHHNGLTPFGRDVVREMNRLGMMVDISHVADKTFWDVLDVSTAPPFASHSSSRAVSNIARNMTDEMIVALAKKGGVVDVNFGCEFVSQKSADAGMPFMKRITTAPSEAERNAVLEEYKKVMVRATLDDAVAHIDHIVKIAGIGAVGIGSDFDGVGCTPIGLDDVSKYPNLTRALLERGYPAGDIRKIYGGNVLRVMRAVEAESARLRAVK